MSTPSSPLSRMKTKARAGLLFACARRICCPIPGALVTISVPMDTISATVAATRMPVATIGAALGMKRKAIRSSGRTRNTPTESCATGST